jgi:hypothetical protein
VLGSKLKALNQTPVLPKIDALFREKPRVLGVEFNILNSHLL